MLLLEKFITFFNCGRIKKDSRNSVHYFVVTNIKDITNKIIPFFNKYNIKGVKSLNFAVPRRTTRRRRGSWNN